MTRKEIATTFLQMASAGDVQEAYERYVHPNFRHHNPYFKGDRASFLEGMEDNARQFPGKTYETLHALEDGDLVAVHGRVALDADNVFGVIHIFRYEGNLIVESWEASQKVLKDAKNENGPF